MSINSAMLSGVSGLIANSAALGAISDNIANVNTVGYKENSTQFEDLVTSKAAAGNYNSGGVQANVTQLVSAQGQFTQTTSPTDLSVNGNGFFVVSGTAAGLSASSGPSFTRAGSFTADASGYLKNSAGLYLQGWAASSTGAISTSPSDLTKLSTINIGDVGTAPDPTTTAAINANLNTAVDATANGSAAYNASTKSMGMYDADPTTGSKPDFSTQVTVYDAQGGTHTVQIDFLKTSTPNTWSAEINVLPASQVSTAGGQVGAGTITFNTDGTFKSTTLPSGTSSTSPNLALTLPWAASTGLSSQQLALNFGGPTGALTQYASTSTTNSTKVDGGPSSALDSIAIGNDGLVTAKFDNGATRVIAQVALATFPDPDGLAAVSGNAYAATGASGTFNLKTPDSTGAGAINSSQLEASTVDLSTEFTGLIITQRAYSAASKIITTADQMLQELISVKQ